MKATGMKQGKGLYWNTALVWIYIETFELYHKFMEMRQNVILIFIFMVFQSSQALFAFNHHNYVRWLTIYHDNLFEVQESEPRVND